MYVQEGADILFLDSPADEGEIATLLVTCLPGNAPIFEASIAMTDFARPSLTECAPGDRQGVAVHIE
jgi:hypothetical protein